MADDPADERDGGGIATVMAPGADSPAAAPDRRLPARALPHAVLPRAPLARGGDEHDERPSQDLFGGARSARTRILASSVVLLAIAAVVSTFAIRQILTIRLDDRIQASGQQEVLELERLLAVGEDPDTGKPFTSPQALFDVYLARNVPSLEEALLTFVDGRFHKSALGRFPLDLLPAPQVADWTELSSSSPGESESVTGRFATGIGTAYYRVRRVVLGDSTGAFVVATLPAAEYEEIEDLQLYGALTTLGVLLAASAVAWLIAGRVLEPVRLLTETARSISQSDLTARIKVRGRDEAAEMARSFNAMLDRLERVFRSQREFVQSASHELRDPITICRGHLELVGDEPEERRKTIAIVLDELDRMGRMVDDLQLLADTEQPDFLRPEWIDVALYTHELTAKVTALAPRRWRVDRAGDGTLLADRDRLTEAVMNLAHNAVQHTLEDETVAIGSSLSDGELRLWVRDTGRGISVADHERIFHRFQRGKGARRRYRGGGLGLAIVRAVAEAHGGRVELKSRVGTGSKFTIVIPRQPGDGLVDG